MDYSETQKPLSRLQHITTHRNLVDEKEMLVEYLFKLKVIAMEYFKKPGTELYHKVWWGEQLVDKKTGQAFGLLFFTARDLRKIGKVGFEFSLHVKQNENTTIANNFSSTSVRAYQNHAEDTYWEIDPDSTHFFCYNDGAFESIVYLKDMLKAAKPLLDEFTLKDSNLVSFSTIDTSEFIRKDKGTFNGFNPNTHIND